MSADLFLNMVEIVALTGYKTRPAQVRALNKMGINHKVRPDGKVVILREHVMKVLDFTSIGGKVGKQTQPDWNAIAKR